MKTEEVYPLLLRSEISAANLRRGIDVSIFAIREKKRARKNRPQLKEGETNDINERGL